MLCGRLKSASGQNDLRWGKRSAALQSECLIKTFKPGAFSQLPVSFEFVITFHMNGLIMSIGEGSIRSPRRNVPKPQGHSSHLLGELAGKTQTISVGQEPACTAGENLKQSRSFGKQSRYFWEKLNIKFLHGPKFYPQTYTSEKHIPTQKLVGGCP